nr:MAG TPA: hypothetical protein [Caudoviricetes sp.]
MYQIHKQFKNPIIFYHLFKLSIQLKSAISGLSPVIPSVILSRYPIKF